MRPAAGAIGVMVLVACGSSGESSNGDGPQPIRDGASSDGDSQQTTTDAWQWQTLLTNTWNTSGPTITCAGTGANGAIVPVTQDMWLDGIRSSAMTEENDHQFLVLQTEPKCNDQTNALGQDDLLLYAAGLGQNEVDFPAGMAVHVSPTIDVINGNGSTPTKAYLVLYDHLSGAGSGTSSLDAHVVANPSTVQHDVDMVLAGQGTALYAGSNAISNAITTIHGMCTPSESTPSYQWNVIGLWPHMHESGRHVTISIQDTPIFDADYTYTNEQTYMQTATVGYMQDLQVSCTLDNTNTFPLTYSEYLPESSGHTVCWTGIYKWPVGSDPKGVGGQPYGPEECVVGVAPTH